jgi:Aspartyl protease
LLAAFGCALMAQTPSHPSVATILSNHAAALAAMHLHEPRSHEASGTLAGLGLTGSFHEWQDGNKERRDERLGFRTQRELRVGDALWVQNTSGEIRELRGLVARRQITEDFIDTGNFAKHPEFAKFIEQGTLPDGRTVYRLSVQPPNGEPYVVAIDAKTWLIDQKSYVDHDSPQLVTYDDYHVVDGMLIPYTEIDSNGDTKFDITSHVTKVSVDEPIDASTFAPLSPARVVVSAPVHVPLEIHNGLPFVKVDIAGHSYNFLVDSGSQGNVLDPRVATQLGLHPDGPLEVRGAERVASLGVVETPVMTLDGVQLPSRVATVLDLSQILRGPVAIDGVLGYPFFAAAELRFDPDGKTLTIAEPGTLPPLGQKLDVDTDRELAEVQATIDNTAKTRLLIDTGNSNELLLFQSFLNAHKGLIMYVGSHYVDNRGAGGSTAAVGTMVDSLRLGDAELYNRYTDVILSHAGAFADQNDGGNVGFGSLHNFISTFDLANRALFLEKARDFDDGRFRSRTESNQIWPPGRS